MENDFTDLDLDKLGELTQPVPAAAVPAPETTPAPVETTPEVKKDEVVPAPVETTPPAVKVDETPAQPSAADEVDKIIKELESATQETDTTANALEEKAKETGDAEVMKLVEELTDNLNKERILRSQEEKEKTLYKTNREQTLDEKNSLDLEVKQKARLYGVIDDDEILQSIVAYSFKSKTDPAYKDKLILAAKELLRREGEDVDAIQKRFVQSEKTAMGDVNNMSPMGGTSAKPESQGVEDMFEQI